MDSLWAPWRMEYVRAPKKDSRNTFSSKLDEGSDKDNLILYRGEHCFVCMNLYPYNNSILSEWDGCEDDLLVKGIV